MSDTGVGACVEHSEDRKQKSLESRQGLHKGMVIEKFGHIVNGGHELSQITGL